MGEEEHIKSSEEEPELNHELSDQELNPDQVAEDGSEEQGLKDSSHLDGEDPLRIALDQALATAEKHRDEALRALAELDNVRKRAERDVESAHKFGMEKFINELLPVKDSMDLGFEAANSAEDVAALREGMALTLKMFDGALEKGGVKAIDPVGEEFDPEFHQAMLMEESLEVEPGKILRVMQKGYSLNDRLVRPAMVVVAKKAASE